MDQAKTVTVELTEIFAQDGSDLELLDHEYNLLDESDNAAKVEETITIDLGPGTYYAYVKNNGNNGLNSYLLSIEVSP